ncbi:MAG: hypothetical protein AAB969_01060, partial [Patescibacteria group bacterium]
MNTLLCPWDASRYIFFSDSAPHLLYYAYIPIILVTLLFIFFLIKKNKTITSYLIFLTGFFFVLWILNILILWASNVPNEQNLSWNIVAVLELPIFIFSYYFLRTFILDRDIDLREKIYLSLIVIPVLLFLPTKYNIEYFYITPDNCGGTVGILWRYIYFIEITIVAWIIFITSKKAFSEENKIERKKKIIFVLATALFLAVFWASNVLGELTQTYEINLVGPIGMVCFIGLLTFIIVRFKAFDVKLVGAQALVWASVILIGSQFFYLTDSSITVKILTAVTLIITSVLGYFLVGSVKKEDALNEELAIANAGQTNLIHIMNHQIKGYLSIA